VVGKRLNNSATDVRQWSRDNQAATVNLAECTLSLDAPLVASTWQWFFAQNFRVALPVISRVALFLIAWLIYLIDRFADSICLRSDSPKTLREAFCLRHKNVWMELILAIALFNTVFVFRRLGHDVFVAGIILGAIAIIYLTINFTFSKFWTAIPVKEIAVGFLFAAGTLLALAPQLFRERSTITESAVAAFIFACLCSLNCMSIAVWERDIDRAQGKHSIATRWPRSDLFVRIFAVILAMTSFLLGIRKLQLWPLAGCFALSTSLLAVLHFIPMPRDERTALADLVLLTPLAWLLVAKAV
jgi:hypothetical protein